MEDLDWINKEELSKLEEIWRLKFTLKWRADECQRKVNDLEKCRYLDDKDVVLSHIIKKADKYVSLIPSGMTGVVLPKNINMWGEKIKEGACRRIESYKDDIIKSPLAFFALISMICTLISIVTCIILILMHNNLGVLFIFISLGLLVLFAVIGQKWLDNRKYCKNQIYEIQHFDFDKIINNIKEVSRLVEDYINLNKEMQKCTNLIIDAKNKFNSIPKKYIDYVSEYDGIPAIFNFIEIIEDRRANNIKELIDTYLNDEFKKGEMIRLGNMQAVLQNQQYEFRKNVQEQQKMMKEMKYNVEQRLKEIKNSIEDIDVSVDVRVTE